MCQMLLKSVQKCISGFTFTEVMAQQKLGQIFVQSETFSVKAQHFIQSNN